MRTGIQRPNQEVRGSRREPVDSRWSLVTRHQMAQFLRFPAPLPHCQFAGFCALSVPHGGQDSHPRASRAHALASDLSEKSHAGNYRKELEREQREIYQVPEVEKREVRDIWRARGGSAPTGASDVPWIVAQRRLTLIASRVSSENHPQYATCDL